MVVGVVASDFASFGVKHCYGGDNFLHVYHYRLAELAQALCDAAMELPFLGLSEVISEARHWGETVQT